MSNFGEIFGKFGGENRFSHLNFIVVSTDNVLTIWKWEKDIDAEHLRDESQNRATFLILVASCA